MLIKFLIYLFYFLSGFAVLPWTKISGMGNIQSFVVVAILIIVIGMMYKKTGVRYSRVDVFYLLFLVTSLPALFLGISYGRSDAIYFYLYTVLPFFLLHETYFVRLDFRRCLILAEISLLIVIFIGWGIRLEYFPMTFLTSEVLESEFKLGYWGLQYTESTRNHDYMYVFTCASIALYLKNRCANYLFKAIQIVIFFLCEITLLSTLSRCAMLLSLLFLPVFYVTSDKRERTVFHIPIVILIIYLLPSIIEEYDTTYRIIFNSIFDDSIQNEYGNSFSNQDRSKIYSHTIRNIFANPVGYGIQNFTATNTWRGGSAENAYLTVFAERGWLAGVFFILFIVYSFVKRSWRATFSSERLNTYLLPPLCFYFMFNYEFVSYSNVFLFYLILFSDSCQGNENVKKKRRKFHFPTGEPGGV